MEDGVGYATDSSFQQKFWRKAFIYAKVLEKDEINSETIDAYCNMRANVNRWMVTVDRLESERVAFLQLKRQHPFWYKFMMLDINTWLVSGLELLFVIFLWPVGLCMTIAILDVTISMASVSTFRDIFSTMWILRRLAPIVKEFLNYWESFEWGMSKRFMLLYYMQAKLIYAIINTS